MIKKEGRRAQIYILAAVILVIIILSLVSVSNYIITRKEPVRFYDLGFQLRGETAKVIDFQTYTGGEEINNFLDLIANYSLEVEPGMDLVIIQGDENELTHEYELTVTTYKNKITSKNSNTVGFDFGSGDTVTFKVLGGPVADIQKIEESFGEGDNNIYVELLNKTYGFKLKENEKFIFVLAKQENQETYVS